MSSAGVSERQGENGVVLRKELIRERAYFARYWRRVNVHFMGFMAVKVDICDVHKKESV